MSAYRIQIADLEVYYRVGVPEEERAQPQRLLVSVDLDVCAPRAASSDALADTIDYFAVSQDLLQFGERGSWKLLERLVADLAQHVLDTYRPESVRVEVKKFIIPQARHVSVACVRRRNPSPE